MNNHTRKRARCTRTAFDELECTLPHYHEGVIEEWKRHIPFKFRSYLPTTKAWRFWGGYQDLAADILLDAFPDAEVPRRARTNARPSERPGGSDHFAALHLLPSAPRALVDSAYRIAAKGAHPDAGGSDEAMRAINTAYDRLKALVPA